jgi:Ca-activated chloride channel family protein
MTFGSPWVLVLLLAIPALVAAYVRARRRRARRAAALSEQGLVVAAASQSRMRVRRHVPFALFTLALTLLVVGMAQPMSTVKTPRREGTVILAVDVSNSMRADDVQPSRMEAAKAAARAFVERQPPAVRMGVVAFGDGAVVVQTPTNAHADVIRSIDRLSSEGGTSLGQALVAALSAIAGKPVNIDFQALASDSAEVVDIGFFGSASVLLFSDGEETSRPDPVAVAQVASTAGVRVHTIGVGTPAGSVVQVDGFSVATALDSELLEEVASITDGAYYEAGDAEGLEEISKTIDLRFKLVSEHIEISGLFAAGGGLLLFVGALLSVLWFGRVV